MRDYFKTDIARLHRLWREWDSYVRLGGPEDTPKAEGEALMASLLERVMQSRIKNKEALEARIRAAWGPAEVKARKPYDMTKRNAATASRAERAERAERVSDQTHLAVWGGPSGDQSFLKRVVGVTWSKDSQRWAIRIKTRLGEYYDTNTEGCTMDDLAYTVDHFKCVCICQGMLSHRSLLRPSTFNDHECAKEKVECGCTPDVDHERLGHLHRNFADWITRHAMKTEDRYRGFNTHLRAIPREAELMARIDAKFGPSIPRPTS